MKGYVIANITVTDPAGYERYKAEAPAIIARFGGRYMVRGPAVEEVEGHLGADRLVILEFESLERAREFYFSPEYQAVARLRQETATSDFVIVEGCSDPLAAASRDATT